MIKVGIVSNLSRDPAGKCTSKVLHGLIERNMKPLVSPFVHKLCKLGTLLGEKELYQMSDLILVLGGDGTILQSSQKAAKYQKPLLGINLGHLGFLAESEMGDLTSILDAISSGSFEIDRRMMLEASIVRNGQVLKCIQALNDVIVSKGSYGRIIHLSLKIDEEFVDYYVADGLLVSSPTGSTAYSLSAGGPVIYPGMECMLVTPVCPHTLTSRPIVTSAASLITIEGTDKDRDIQVTVDGQQIDDLVEGDYITISKSSYETQLIHFPGYSFYNLLRNKLSIRNE